MQDSTKRQSAVEGAFGRRAGFLASVFGGSTFGGSTDGPDQVTPTAFQPAGASAAGPSRIDWPDGGPHSSADTDADTEPDTDGHQAGEAGAEPDGHDPAVAALGRAAELTHHRTATVRAEQQRLAGLLARLALPVSAMDFESQRRNYEPRPYPEGPSAGAGTREPRWTDFEPAASAVQEPGSNGSSRLLDSGYQRELAQARLAHQRALRQWRTERAVAADPAEAAARLAHEEAEQGRARAVREYNDSLEECRRAYREGEPAAVESLLERALAAAEAATPELPAACRAVFRPLTRTAVLDLDLPPLGLVPSLDGYRLTAEGEISPVPRPPADRAADYLRLVARLALRALQAADAVDTDGMLAGVVLNGWLREPEATCLLTVDADRDALARTRLVEPVAPDEEEADPGVYAAAEQDEALVRLRGLGAAVSPDPYARAEVRPCATAGAAVPAVADLSPGEFAVLVREVLTRGGLRDWSVRLRGHSGLVATGTGAPGSALPGRWVVCASRRPGQVGATEVRTLAEAVAEESAGHGLWLSTGGFTEEALDLTDTAEYRQIHLADGEGFRALAETHLGLPLATGTV
ncbi:restriction endonuclease [Kitasatospora sp. NBC_01287]|uniref:restriction endonuclease n=1 Tax=Kitasatospora sp. NBC_01287 TaxID=2903573 RepID=UPI00224D47B4|nr:restriction endonuclease [Kitasatospora sp. NBC_01287]MCX4746430.1 restriction endonuclease [Kitasatospora sp. NBC_01287]